MKCMGNNEILFHGWLMKPEELANYLAVDLFEQLEYLATEEEIHQLEKMIANFVEKKCQQLSCQEAL